MSLDEMYDNMLHDEFRPRGKHEAMALATETELAERSSPGRHAAAEEPEPERSGFQRYRTGALVGAGGLACAVAGALLGGLGGYFSISPAAAHPTAAPTITQDLPLAQAANEAAPPSTSGAEGSLPVTAAGFSKEFGSLINGSALTSEPFGNLPASALPGLAGSSTKSSGGGGGGGGTAAGGSPLSGLPVPTGGTSSNPAVGALGTTLNTVGAAASGAGTSVPSLPLPTTTSTTIPSLPSGTTGSRLPSTTNLPLPLPVPATTPSITIGGSVGINNSGSTSGLTLTLP